MDTDEIRKLLDSVPFEDIPKSVETLQLLGVEVKLHMIMKEKIWVSCNGDVFAIWNPASHNRWGIRNDRV